MRRSSFVLDEEAQLAFAAAVGMKLAACVDEVEMLDENHKARRWAAVKCHQLEKKYERLTEAELGWIVEGILVDMLRNTFWGQEFWVNARVSLRNNDKIQIAYRIKIFE